MNQPSLANMIADSSCTWFWREGLTAQECQALTVGSLLWCLYAPSENTNLRGWCAVQFRIELQFDTVLKRNLRLYVVVQKIDYANNPMIRENAEAKP